MDALMIWVLLLAAITIEGARLIIYVAIATRKRDKILLGALGLFCLGFVAYDLYLQWLWREIESQYLSAMAKMLLVN